MTILLGIKMQQVNNMSYEHPGFELWQARMNSMVVHTCFNNKSYFGFKANALKSGICKYMRRSKRVKFMWCVTEMLLFNFHEKGGGLVTNLINRLKILLMEEMSVSEISRIILGIKKLDEFEKSGRKDMERIIEFCKIVIGSRKTRSASYINWWWLTHPEEYNLNDVVIDKVKKYEKKGDSEELLKLGEILIKFVEDRDERIFDIFNKMVKIEKGGRRYRRTDGLYLYMEIIEDHYVTNEYYKIIFDFALEMINRKSMKERLYFGIWIGMLMWNKTKEMHDDVHIANAMRVNDQVTSSKGLLDYFIEREKIVLDDYVVKDYHVNKKYTLEKFSKVGGWVKNEDKSLLGEEKFMKYKNNYIKLKEEAALKKKSKKKKSKKKSEKKKEEKNKEESISVVSEDSTVTNISVKKQPTEREKMRNEKYKKIKKMRGKPKFEELESKLENIGDINEEKIKLCSDMTCGNKVMCFEYNDKIWKESRKSMNYNRDYCVLDDCKELFGLKKIGMKRVLANFRIEKIDKNKKNWKDNWHKVMIGEDEEKVVYCVMNKITNCNWDIPMEIGVIKHSLVYGCENGGNIGQNKALFKEFVKIGVYRGIFRCSDFNCRNVLVGLVDQFSPQYLVSIDEGDIGKRLDILGKREKWLVDGLNNDKTVINEILDELTADLKCNFVLNKMKEYKFSNDLCNEIINNWNNLRKDLEAEGVEF